VRKVLFILGGVIVGFMVLPVFRIHTATVALAGGFILLAVENKQAKDVLKKISFTDIIFFSALFIIVGGALHAGLLKGISNGISSLSGGNKTLYLIILMWTVAFVTAFLNAGPATALFIPIMMHSHFAAFSDIIWWALSLGVLAGSSATITGATAGIVSQGLLEDRSVDMPLTFGDYSRKGVPIALMFLAISSVYIMFLCGVVGMK
jgi:Na+/H+ antiporter NhaD/arsenite permease-like protein